MTPVSSRQAFIRLAGWLLATASAVFLVIVARQHWVGISAIDVTPRQWLAIAGLSIIYGASLFLLAAAWHAVLVFVGAGPPGQIHSMRAYATAQLAKYVPGNVFHLVGRHMIHRSAGMPDKRLAVAALVEALVMLAAASTVVVVSLLVDLPAWSWPAWPVVAALALVAVAAARLLRGRAVVALFAAFLACLVFFAIMGGIIALIVAMLGGALSWGAGRGGVAAWIAGFVTPGAPGGLGVREATMVLLGGGGVPEQVLIVAAGLFRLVTFAGDVVCFALGRLVLRERIGAEPVSA